MYTSTLCTPWVFNDEVPTPCIYSYIHTYMHTYMLCTPWIFDDEVPAALDEGFPPNLQDSSFLHSVWLQLHALCVYVRMCAFMYVSERARVRVKA